MSKINRLIILLPAYQQKEAHRLRIKMHLLMNR